LNILRIPWSFIADPTFICTGGKLKAPCNYYNCNDYYNKCTQHLLETQRLLEVLRYDMKHFSQNLNLGPVVLILLYFFWSALTVLSVLLILIMPWRNVV